MKVTPSNKERLDDLKRYRRESYNETIERLLEIYELFKAYKIKTERRLKKQSDLEEYDPANLYQWLKEIWDLL